MPVTRPPRLLSREEFSRACFERDGYACVACPPAPRLPAGTAGLAAHHLLNRDLWTEVEEFGGYFVDNGATVCDSHHLQAEYTTLPPYELRRLAGITRVALPRQLPSDDRYDTWGNTVLANGTRLRGPLFALPSCQKALAAGGALSSFLPYVKYPRTSHLSWSEGVSEDDMTNTTQSGFEGRRVVVTEKLDGECSSLYRDFYHARSLATPHHPSQTKLKAFHASMGHEIPEGWRVTVENCAAMHSISYTDLETLFPVVSIWNEANVCLSWPETEEWASLMGLPTVPVLYRGPWDPERIKSLYTPQRGSHDMEGYVVRLEDSFPYSAFRTSVAKFVSRRFRQALLARDGVHWASAAVVWNKEKSQGRKP